MKVAIISLGSISSKMLAEELKNYFEEVDMLDIGEIEVSLGEKKAQVLYKGKPLPKYDCIYAKGSYKYATLLRAVTTLVQKETYVPLKSPVFTIGHDKVLTHLKLQEFEVPQPTTYIASTAEAGKKIIKKIHYPAVMKLPSGTHGKGVMLADSQESASGMIDALGLLKQPFLIQEFIETDGTDLRILVVGTEVIASMKRIAANGEGRANMHAGGNAEKILIDQKTKKVAITASHACGAEICAIDILQSAKGPLVLEINLSPGLQGITKATKINVAKKIAEYLYKKTKEFREGPNKEVMKLIESEHEIVGSLDFKGNRILLPEIVSMASKILPTDEVTIKAKKGKIEIKK